MNSLNKIQISTCLSGDAQTHHLVVIYGYESCVRVGADAQSWLLSALSPAPRRRKRESVEAQNFPSIGDDKSPSWSDLLVLDHSKSGVWDRVRAELISPDGKTGEVEID